MPATSWSIVMIASEAVPYAKTGGLADVAGALPLALARLGHRVTLVLPRYRGVESGEPAEFVELAIGGRPLKVGVLERRWAEGARVVLLDCPELYDRADLYGIGNDDYPDNALRFAALVRGACEYVVRSGAQPDLIHAHDWQTGLAPVYLKTRYAWHPALGRAATVFTIHNLAYQGHFPPAILPALDLGWELYTTDGLEYWGGMSMLKAGINFADVITTVSPTYAKEIQTPEFGFGFDGILKRRGRDLVGILNGIDTTAWDPATDPHIPAAFGPADLAGKATAKTALLEALGLPSDGPALARPVVGMISRLVDQKGFDLVADAVGGLLRLDATYVLLGSGEARYQQLWTDLAQRHPDRVGVRIGFDEPLAHLIEAGADIFLMPSRFEPCGLNQMYSQRYGTVPVVRVTGGLDDTVRDFSPRTGKGTGFKFKPATSRAMLEALARAIAAFGQPAAWRAIQEQGMAQDFSWDHSARQYVKIYRRALEATRVG